MPSAEGSLESRLERRRTVSQKKIVQPMIDELKEKQKQPKDTGVAGEKPLEPAELDQDAGSGYNTDGTFPQT